ncbi:MAG: hypothetical protein V1838_01220 [Patescibacteria group bacterium]
MTKADQPGIELSINYDDLQDITIGSYIIDHNERRWDFTSRTKTLPVGKTAITRIFYEFKQAECTELITVMPDNYVVNELGQRLPLFNVGMAHLVLMPD